MDDIAPHLNCAKDKDKFTKDTSQALADAQAYFLNAVNAQFVKKHSDIEPLLMVPTDYSGSQANPYKSELGIALDADIAVLWTGEEVVSHRITTESTRAAQMTYGAFLRPRGLVIWDNYPVNDFAPNRLFLAPVVGRDRDLYTATAGIAANPMSEPYASLPTLFNFADFTWNGPAYDPVTSMAAALKLLAGPDDDVLVSLTAFADLNQNWQDDELTPNAPGLSADIEAFWEAYYGGPDPEAATSSSDLASRVGLIQTMPQTLSDMADQEFYLDTQHWIDAAGLYGDALDASLRMLAAVEADDEDDVMDARSELDAAVEEAGEATQPSIGGRLLIPEVGDGVFQEFIAEAMSVADEWLG